MNNNNRSFKELLQRANLIDLGFKGPAYTWTNSQFRSQPIYQRLDSAIVSTNWQEKFPSAYVSHLYMVYSDHCPILLQIKPRIKRNKVFRMEHWWMQLRGFDEECERLWRLSVGMRWERRQQMLREGLLNWARRYPSPANRLKEIEKELLQIQAIHPSLRDLSAEHNLRQEFEQVHTQLEIFWHQRSRVNWMSFGDHNTKYFHNAATVRRRQNLITTLQREDGTWTATKKQTRGLLVSYFKNLYTQDREVEKVVPGLVAQLTLPTIQPEAHLLNREI
jgi:hypothetical protein